MNKAEELATQQYPDKEGTEGICTTWLQRNAYKKGYEQAVKDLGWHSVDDCLPPIGEEVIVLTDNIHGETVKGANCISFGHIVDKAIAVDYNGWNIPGVHHWMSCPKLPE